MPRKKISTAPAGAGNVAYLDDDEQLVEEVTTTKRIGRQRRKPDADDDEPIVVDGQIIEDDDDGDDVEKPFSDTSIAAIIYGEGSDQVENQFCNINMRRYPDSMNDKFLTPCTEITNLPRLTNLPLSTDTADIEDRVRSEYGGGHYFFQIFYDGRLGRSWRSTLADLPQAVAAAKLAATTPATPQPTTPPVPVDPMAQLINNLTQTKQLSDLLFGDTKARLEAEIERLKAEAAKVPAAVAVEKPEKLLLLEAAASLGKSDLTDRIVDSIFPVEEDGGKRHWIAETLDVVLTHKDSVLGLLGNILGGPTPPPTQTNIADMMRGPAPELPAGGSRFQRRGNEPPAAGTQAASLPVEPVHIGSPEREAEIRDIVEGKTAEPEKIEIVAEVVAPLEAHDLETADPFETSVKLTETKPAKGKSKTEEADAKL